MAASLTLNEARYPWLTWTLTGSGLLLLLSGGVWWAWDADPSWGRTLMLLGLVVVVTGFLIRKRLVCPIWVIVGLAAVVAVFGCYEIWRAIATILFQGATHTA